MTSYNVGILGFGFIGKVHAYGYRTLPFFYDPVPLQARITHVCTSRPETAEKARHQIGADAAVSDYRQITENPEIDIVHICTPNHLHKEALLSAIRHQKHIYCDKPLVATLDEAEQIERALIGYRGTAQMTLQNRFFPAVMRAKQLVDEGWLGQVLQYRLCYLQSSSASPLAPARWKLLAEAGGGVIADLGPHVFDLIQCLLGDFDQVMADSQIAYPQRPARDDPGRMVPVDAEDSVLVLGRLNSGVLGSIEATKIATGMEDDLRLEIHGSEGALRFHGRHADQLDVFDARAEDQPIGGRRGWTSIATGQRYPEPATGFPSPKASIGWVRSHVACLEQFLRSVAAGEPGNPGLDQGIYLQRVMAAVGRSIRQRQWVSVGRG